MEPLVRTAYWRALELVEALRRAGLGGEEPPCVEGPESGHPDKTAEVTGGLASKAKPPLPPPGRRSPPREKVAKKKREEKRSPKKEKSPSPEKRKKSPSPEKSKRRSKSPESSEEYIEESEEEEVYTEEPLVEPKEDERKERREDRDRRRDSGRERSRQREAPESQSLRPRSPTGPPPQRPEAGSSWRGPIPSYKNREPERPPLPRRYPKPPENKGVKKKRQQARYKKNKARLAAKRQRAWHQSW